MKMVVVVAVVVGIVSRVRTLKWAAGRVALLQFKFGQASSLALQWNFMTLKWLLYYGCRRLLAESRWLCVLVIWVYTLITGKIGVKVTLINTVALAHSNRCRWRCRFVYAWQTTALCVWPHRQRVKTPHATTGFCVQHVRCVSLKVKRLTFFGWLHYIHITKMAGEAFKVGFSYRWKQIKAVVTFVCIPYGVNNNRSLNSKAAIA